VLVDEAEVTVRAGKGGRGAVSFRREKFVPKGGPDGGDGGKGGDVLVRSSSRVRTLVDFKRRRVFKAADGKPGAGQNMSGAFGKDCVLMVPVGTVIRSGRGGEILADLDGEDGCVVVAKGGLGGRGNARFKSPTNRAPRHAEEGRPGEEKALFLELKLIADVGLVGIPNAGKSSLLRKVSRARPRVADYAFTTKSPVLGTVVVDEFFSFVMADIPGLIEGSHLNRGLGHRFLKHIERTRVLVFLLDVSVGDPRLQLRRLRRELREYSGRLLEKPSLTVLNKIDLLGPPAERESAGPGESVAEYMISALTGEGIPELLKGLKETLQGLEEER